MMVPILEQKVIHILRLVRNSWIALNLVRVVDVQYSPEVVLTFVRVYKLVKLLVEDHVTAQSVPHHLDVVVLYP